MPYIFHWKYLQLEKQKGANKSHIPLIKSIQCKQKVEFQLLNLTREKSIYTLYMIYCYIQ